MEDTAYRAIAIVGVGAVLPNAPNAPAFWENVKSSRDCISEVTPDRWDSALYYDPDPSAPDKTYSKIGGWVREHTWDPVKWRLPVPPKVAAGMDDGQKWAVSCTREALEDYGYPKRPLDLNRTAVILGNAMAGEKHYLTALRAYFPEYARELDESPSFAALPPALRRDITRDLHNRIDHLLPEITEDTMPGELANCIAGRVANLFNFRGPNYTCDAACASAMAAIHSAVDGLVEHEFDVAITGGLDRNMGAATFIKFCKIGALSGTGSRPYSDGADGFVMGEGAAIFMLKRLAEAERDGDKIYAVLRGIGGSSDGKGKGMTAPNPVGQKLSVERAWENAGLSPATVTLIEGHGTSTRVGDLVEAQTMTEVLAGYHLPVGSVALGSVKSNIGHLKGAAGAAGILKATFALRDKMLPPSLHFEHPNPGVDFAHSPLQVNTELRPWPAPNGDGVRRAGVSAFGFGGTNFHAVLEEYIPHRLSGNGNGRHSHITTTVPPAPAPGNVASAAPAIASSYKAPLRGALLIGADSVAGLTDRLRTVQKSAAAGQAPAPAPPAESDLHAPERVAVDYSDASDLADKSAKALKALAANQPAIWKALRAQGIFRGHGSAGKVAFLYTGQGSQYVNMLKPLRAIEPIVAQTFDEADRIMTPLLGRPLRDFIFIDAADPAALAKAEDDLRQTAITQPAVLATDLSLTRLLAAYGIQPDMTMGHSLGEYGALVAAGAIPFADALEAVSARGREMAKVSTADNGLMLAVFAPLAEIERILKTIEGYVVIANINSNTQAVVGGATKAVQQAQAAFQKAGYEATLLPVSQAFHTAIVANASEPLRRVLERLHLESPRLPIVANVDGEFYPTGPGVVPQMLDILALQVASPVQFVKGLRTLYNAGARVFVEVGPKKALQVFAEEVLGDRGDVVSLFTNHPKVGDVVSFNHALCGLYAAGLGRGTVETVAKTAEAKAPVSVPASPRMELLGGDRYAALGRMFAGVLERGWELYGGGTPVARNEPVVITGAALGLPGTEHIFDDGNLARILAGDQFIDAIPTRFRRAMLDKHITRLVKTGNGGPAFETISNVADVIKLAGRGGAFNLEQEFGVPADRVAALDRVTALAIGAGIDALRDAGIPLVLRYKTTSKGTQLPDHWGLPDALRDDTGVIFASAFPGYGSLADEMTRYYADRGRRDQLAMLENLRDRASAADPRSATVQELDRRIGELRTAIEKDPYVFDRRFIFRTLPMGHSQFAEFIGARGPNTHINAACASTTQAQSLAEDWIRAGHCRRVIIVSADDVTSDHLIEWIGSGFLASGAAATDEIVEEVAIPFDRRRHGMVMGMGAAALVVESADAARERGIRPICEVLSAVASNSAFHGTRLDVQHICQIMESLVARAEAVSGIGRHQLAREMTFVSHETYTPARGGSAAAEINALRHVFGGDADRIVIANTKGLTGHAMGTGIEDVVAVKALETGWVPPVANFKEVDPELGVLNLSKGGTYPVEYALHLAAGFGSQISMTLLRRVKADEATTRPGPHALGYAYRIADRPAWDAWLSQLVGGPAANLEVVNRTLRVKDTHAAVQIPAASQEPIAVAATPVPEPAKPAPKSDPVKDQILALVAEKTGYPVDMLNLDLDLEADLGVDTVKQAEVLSTVRETFGLAKNEQLKLRDFPTLAHVIQFVYDRRPDLAGKAEPAPIAPAPLAPAPEPAASAVDPVQERILALAMEKTGYPRDMLALDLDLEADLGVDTVKQAEMIAAIREAYNIPRDDNRKLRDFPTLAHVIRFVHESRPDLAVAVTSAPTSTPQAVPERAAVAATATSPASDPVTEQVLAIVAEKTGYPKDMLDLDLDLEADLGVDTVKQAETFAAVREIYNIPRDDNRKLRDFPTLAHLIRFVHESRPDLAVAVTTVSTPAPQAVPAKAATAAAAAAPAGDPITEQVLAIVAEKTGYPKDMLDLELDLEADLGIDTVKQAETIAAVRELFHIPRDDNRSLRDYPTLAHVIRFVHESVGQALLPAAGSPAGQTNSSPASDPITDQILAIVAEKTGYPKDMLDLDLDLEADLGVDTVKQAETLAAVRAAFNIPRDENLSLRNFPTLAHIIRFARDKGAVAPDSAVVEIPEPAAEPARSPLASLDAANEIPRRVPIPNLRPPLAICKPTGVTLAAGARVIIMPDQNGVAGALAERLQAKGVEVLRIEGTHDLDTFETTLKNWLAAGPVQGVYWLPALDQEPDLTTMDFANWREALRLRTKLLYTTMRIMAPAGAFLLAATRLGGQHGYTATGATAPLGGAVVGFTKTYKRESPDVLVKAVDFETERTGPEIAGLLIEETLLDPGAVEIGYTGEQRWTIGLAEQPAADGQPGMTLDSSTVFLITGAAGSIVSAITADLAAASGGTFYLLDLTPEPDPSNPDLDRFANDREALKRDLFARMQARGERATPVLVDKELAAIERMHAARSAIDAVRASGGTPHYFSVNLTDPESVAAVVQQVREQSGRIDVLLHAAGMERSHFLKDKDQREFDLVFDVKADGWFNLLRAIGDMPLGATVAFSSVAGRFGNAGQSDYSAANDLLCKITSSFRTTRPATRGIVIDWTAWGGIGMATRGSIPKMMALAGIDMLPPEAGIPLIRRELTAGGTRGEIVVANRLGILTKEWDATGGLDPDKIVPARGPMIGKLTSLTLEQGLTVETTLDPAVQPFLYDHQIDGTPVLPGVMGIEAFAEAALALVPGWHVDAVENVDFHAPFKFYRHEPRTLTIEATLYPQGDHIVADCRLIGKRQLSNQAEPQSTTHFTARVRLAKQAREALPAPAPGEPAAAATTAADIYRVYFHGPAYQVTDRVWTHEGQTIGLMAESLPANHHPSDLQAVMAPRLIELCFQTAGLWEMGTNGTMGLPQQLDRVQVYRMPEQAEGRRLYAVVTPEPDAGCFKASIVDSTGNRYVDLTGYRTVALPAAVEAEPLKALRAGIA